MWEEMWENISENPLFIYKIQYLMRWFGTSPATKRKVADRRPIQRGKLRNQRAGEALSVVQSS